MPYTPTSVEEFPRQTYAARTDLSPGIYDGENSVLYFAKMPGMIWCSTSRIREVVVADGVISCTVLQPSHCNRRLWADTRNLEGTFSYMCDSVNRNYNITIHPDVARLTLKATAVPRPLTSVDARMMTALKERLYADEKFWHK